MSEYDIRQEIQKAEGWIEGYETQILAMESHMDRWKLKRESLQDQLEEMKEAA